MPHEVTHTNPPPGKSPNTKGKPLGIPKWGWAAAIAIGLIVGYILVKRSGSSAASTTGSDTGTNTSSPQGNSGGAGGGASSAPSPTVIPTPSTPNVTTEQQSPNPVPSPDSNPVPNFIVGAPTLLPAPSGQPLQTTGNTSSTYTVPVSGGGQSAPISTSTGHGPQLTG